MFRNLLLMYSLFLVVACHNTQSKTTHKKERIELVPEPDKDIREKGETIQKLKNSGCIFLHPDTSLSGIKLRDTKSAVAVIGGKNKKDESDEYHFYSAVYGETLTLTQHAGDGNYVISIFKIETSDKADHGYRQLPVNTFITESGIKLGMSRKQIIDRLGNCYTTIDSVKGYIELSYRLETPADSKTQILDRYNMPVYYASYKLWNNKLEKFEFGFEYP